MNKIAKPVKNEILNVNNFEEITTTADTHLTTVRNKINSTAIDLQQNQEISMDDKTLITGLSPKNKAKLAPEYKAVLHHIHTHRTKCTNYRKKKAKRRNRQ